jgi:hypothetical protein
MQFKSKSRHLIETDKIILNIYIEWKEQEHQPNSGKECGELVLPDSET